MAEKSKKIPLLRGGVHRKKRARKQKKNNPVRQIKKEKKVANKMKPRPQSTERIKSTTAKNPKKPSHSKTPQVRKKKMVKKGDKQRAMLNAAQKQFIRGVKSFLSKLSNAPNVYRETFFLLMNAICDHADIINERDFITTIKRPSKQDRRIAIVVVYTRTRLVTTKKKAGDLQHLTEVTRAEKETTVMTTVQSYVELQKIRSKQVDLQEYEVSKKVFFLLKEFIKEKGEEELRRTPLHQMLEKLAA